jgi:hypothetical protein
MTLNFSIVNPSLPPPFACLFPSALPFIHTHLHPFLGLIGNRGAVRILADRLLRHGIQTYPDAVGEGVLAGKTSDGVAPERVDDSGGAMV